MITFNHTVSTIQESIGIPDMKADTLTASIMYEMMNQSYLLNSLYDNPEDAPPNLRTKTGILERVFEEASNEQERLYVMWEMSKFDIIASTDSKRLREMSTLMSMMYVMSDKKKQKFIDLYIKKKNKVRDEMSGSDYDDDDE